jgi:hypothetical protein
MLRQIKAPIVRSPDTSQHHRHREAASMPVRIARLTAAVFVGALLAVCAGQAAAQRALGVVVSEPVDSWMVGCTRDLVTNEIACSMSSAIEMYTEMGWRGLEPAWLDISVEVQNGEARPAIRIAAPDFSFGAIVRLDDRRAFRVDGSCIDAECRVGDTSAQRLAEELSRSGLAVIRGVTGPDLRVHLTGYSEAWSRLVALTADRARPADLPVDLFPPAPSPPPVPPPPAVNTDFRNRL